MKFLLSFYLPKLPLFYVYMLQQVEYNPAKYWDWLKRLFAHKQPINRVMKRKQLIYTSRAKLLLLVSYMFSAWYISVAIILASGVDMYLSLLFFAGQLIMLPLLIALLLFVVSGIGFLVIVKPQQNRLVQEAAEIFASHKAIKIAVLGSYGKTTMKELLAHTLASGGMLVASTPGNMNVSVSHARFARKLNGKEDVIIVEFGEGEPGDIARMAQMLKPDWAIVTGLAPNHLDLYANVEAVAADLFAIYNYVSNPNQVLFNGDSSMLMKYAPSDAVSYNSKKIFDWAVSDVYTGIDKTSFALSQNKNKIQIKSGLLGRHQIGPLSVAAILPIELGVDAGKVSRALSDTTPYSHRMQPRLLQGAWVIDDTYNGNIEGMKAGLELLSELDAKRKWYVTPGLVDQGEETIAVHKQLGEAIAKARPDIVVLMDNSVRPIIEMSMQQHGFKGELRIETNPLAFYTGIEHLVAVGDIVLMQNDWTDNYN